MKLFILSRILVWNRYGNITIDIELSEVKKEETITPWQKKDRYSSVSVKCWTLHSLNGTVSCCRG